MKKAATRLFKWQNKNRAFLKIIEFLFWPIRATINI